MLISEYFLWDADFVGSLIVFSQDKDESDDGTNDASYIRKVGIDFIEVTGVVIFFHSFQEV